MMRLHWSLGWVVVAGALLLTGCAEWPRSTSPRLDSQFGQALSEAKRQQSLPPTAPLSPEAAAAGAGLPTATETGNGLQAQQHGRPAPPAFSSAR